MKPPNVPDWSAGSEDYAIALRKFMLDREYQKLGWLHDLNWRLTGPYEGCPPDGENEGVHPAVRIYYSPKVVEWLCDQRSGELPDGAMIVKEMTEISHIAVDQRGLIWLPPQHYQEADSWTVMVKNKSVSADGWLWANPSATWIGNPRIFDRSASNVPDYFADTDKLLSHDPGYFPTGNSTQNEVGGTWTVQRRGLAVYPYYGFGNYCINCHGEAVSESTYSTLDTLLGKEHRYRWSAAVVEDSYQSQHSKGADGRNGAAAAQSPTFPAPQKTANKQFEEQFPEWKRVSYGSVLETRFPAETYDHSISPTQDEIRDKRFLTSDQCLQCHDAGGANMVFTESDGRQRNLSPYGEWRASPMGLAGRDPIFFSQLESETNRLPEQKDCIQNTCLSCHGATGQRQLNADVPQQKRERCQDLIPTRASRLFTREIVTAWPRGDNFQDALYGGQARDGITCTVCHRISDQDLGKESTFTGRFHTVGGREVLGPFEDDLRTKPMEHALGVTPKVAKHVSSSELCGSCHTIKLPVFDRRGKASSFKFEQTTYLEWLNSAFAGQGGQSCQDCHMPNSYHDRRTRADNKLEYKIANIEDDTFPAVDNRLPDQDIQLTPRKGFRRHTLYGLNIFLNEMFQQFPEILGIRQLDYMNGKPIPGLVTAREAVLDVAQRQTVKLEISPPDFQQDTLTVQVTVHNLAGHHFPSGVGFRRAFLELLLLDAAGVPVWASGRTNSMGAILDGLSDKVLSTELLGKNTSRFQAHHQLITSPNQVQVYEEVNFDQDGDVTTSFLHRWRVPKDNRLRPRGWSSTGPWAKETEPEGKATQDPDYQSPKGKPLTGQDSVTYKIRLPAQDAARAATARATLFYQAIPPYYLTQRLDAAAQGPDRSDTERLYYLASRLNVDVKDDLGVAFMEDWKLRLASIEARIVRKEQR